MKRMSSSKRLLVAIALGSGVALTACSTTPPARNSLDYVRLEAVEQTEVLELTPGASGLSNMDRGRVSAFLADYQQSAGGPLVITVPTTGGDDAQVRQLASQAEAFAAGFGIGGASIARGSYQADPQESAPVILAYSSFKVVTPDCPDARGISYSNTFLNNPPANFGCAVMTNIAQMIAYPGDLAGARPFGPADTARRAVVLEKYRAGESTATARSDEESGTIATAVE